MEKSTLLIINALVVAGLIVSIFVSDFYLIVLIPIGLIVVFFLLVVVLYAINTILTKLFKFLEDILK